MEVTEGFLDSLPKRQAAKLRKLSACAECGQSGAHYCEGKPTPGKATWTNEEETK